MTRVLVEIIAQLAVFLELAEEDVLKLEAAVQQQEDIASKLQQLTPAERTEFVRLLNEIAEENPFEAAREYLRSLPEAVGIV